MDTEVFRKVAESLKQYRRAELDAFAEDTRDIVDELYTDPLPNDAVLKTVLSPNTTFLIGRKGTGKSTIFLKAQREIRKGRRSISAYIDVKSLYEETRQSVAVDLPKDVDPVAVQSYLMKKTFIATVLRELIGEVEGVLESLSTLERFTGGRKKYKDLMENLEDLANEMAVETLRDHEIPVLRSITTRKRHQKGQTTRASSRGGLAVTPLVLNTALSAELSEADEVLTDESLYREYSSVLISVFPFADMISRICQILNGAGLERLFVFFDDFSELRWVDQRLFVDVVLSQLNNASRDKIKLKVAAYPGRVYYGQIDATKVDQVRLDFYDLYRAPRLQDIETSACEYTQRLLAKRFAYFGRAFSDFVDPDEDLRDIYYHLFAASFNIPRVLGFILHYCYLDRISRNRPITRTAIVLASQRYYEEKLLPSFELNRYALEPYETKLDRHNQRTLMNVLVKRAREVRSQILKGQIGGSLFKGLSDPPTSHFVVSSSMEKLLSWLEFNTFVSKYHQMRDKDGKDISVFAFNYGLTSSERMAWGYPKGKRYDKDYFKQRIFNFHDELRQFMLTIQTIVCDNCGKVYPITDKDAFERFNWRCPECQTGRCSVHHLDTEFQNELRELDESLMLEPVELGILQVLHDEKKAMRARDISVLLDVTYQLVGKRTERLQERGYVTKHDSGGQRLNVITEKAERIYFSK